MPAAGGGGPPSFPGTSAGGGFSGASIGRISGPLLKDNLVRNGVDLSFETDLLYLNVIDDRIGINTDSPARELEISTSVKTTNLIVDNLITAANIEIDSNDTISTSVGKLYLNATDHIRATALATDDLLFDNNRLSVRTTNGNLELRPTNGTIFNSNVWVNGNLHATGDITFDGDIVLGDNDTDSVNLKADVLSNLLPDQSLTYSLGSTSKRWNLLYTDTVNSATITTNSIAITGHVFNLGLTYTNAHFVSVNGNDSNNGDHEHSPFRTIARALSAANVGDTVYIFPGTYSEVFPLSINPGVSVVGFDIRTTIVKPTEATNHNDAFLVRGQVTISDLTIKDFYYDAVGNTGHAFRFANGTNVTSRSPYIQNVSVITSANESFPAGRGAYIDGSVVDISSKEASMLFHSCTFITPDVDCITATNGARVEWLNSFTYFAYRGIHLTEGSTGFTQGYNSTYSISGNQLKIEPSASKLTLLNVNFSGTAKTAITTAPVGTVYTVTYTDLTTDILTLTSEWTWFGGDFIGSGPVTGFTASEQKIVSSITINAGLGGVVKYGAEMRSIGSANVYGTYGIVADGPSTLAYLISHNFAYIGSGLDHTNDNTLTIQENEVVELNNGKIHYVSQSHTGDFRIGDIFYVDFAHGNVSFDTAGIVATGLSNLTIEGDGTVTRIDATKIEVGEFRLAGNTIQTLVSPFNINAANNEITFDLNVTASKNINIVGNFQTEGTLTLGNQSQDTLIFSTRLSQDINPKTTVTYDLGSSSKIWRDAYLNSIKTANVKFSNSRIETTLADDNLSFVGNGTGGVKLETLLITNNTIISTVTNDSIKFTPFTGNNVVITGTNAVKVPRTTAILNTTGELRYNTLLNQYEGFKTALTTLGGVYSSDKKTSVLAHPTNNTVNFTINNIVTTTISSDGLTTNALYVGPLQINSNTLTATNNNNITFVSNGVIIDDYTIEESAFTVTLDKNLEIGTTGQGSYVQFTGDKAIVIPFGPDIDRPSTPYLGNTRFNSERGNIEVWDGSQWVSASGSGELATFEYADEQTTLWSLVLG